MDPVKAASRWHSWAAGTTAAQVARLFDALDANLPGGWKRLTGEALATYQSLVRDGSRWYAIDTAPAHSGVTLSLELFRASEVRGGRVWFTGPPYPAAGANIPGAWDQVIRFLDHGIVPAARAAGAQLRLPTPDDIFLSELPSTVRDRLRHFSDRARKSLPLSREEAEAWREFVVAAYRSKTVIDAEPLTDWLVRNGWRQELANELSLRFFDQSLLLSRFADEVSAV
jgi:hypothetical protein